VDIAPIDPWNVPGRYGWVGGTGTSAHVNPSAGTVAILLTQVAAVQPGRAGLDAGLLAVHGRGLLTAHANRAKLCVHPC
jgi:CubicO group peptidase (beta-lactamase class C family)